MEEEITIWKEGNLDLNFLCSLGIEDPEVVPYSLWEEKLGVH